MLTPEQYQQLKNKIMEAVSPSGFDLEAMANGCSPATIKTKGSPITLADVLRAVNSEMLAIDATGTMIYLSAIEIYSYHWNLVSDLDGQTDEVKEFLYKILNN